MIILLNTTTNADASNLVSNEQVSNSGTSMQPNFSPVIMQ